MAMTAFFDKHRVLVAVLYLVVLPLAILLPVAVENRGRSGSDHRQIVANCERVDAIVNYILARYKIDKSLTSTPAEVFAKRLAAIHRLQAQVADISGCTKGPS